MREDGGSSDQLSRELLIELGFTEYEAACLVAIVERPGTTAADIARSSALPRSRVYDVADDLAARGFLEVEEGEPKRYRALPSEEIVGVLRDRYDGTLRSLEENLEEVEEAEVERTDGSSVWSFTGRRGSLSRSWEVIESAEERAWLLVRPGLLSHDCVEVLQSAVERGVTVTISTDDEGLREWLAEELPDATLTALPPALREGDDTEHLVRLQVVDRDAVLTVTRWQETPASQPEYVGCMGTGRRCGFVIACRSFVDHLIPPEPDAHRGDREGPE